jgi:hypothetical protein
MLKTFLCTHCNNPYTGDKDMGSGPCTVCRLPQITTSDPPKPQGGTKHDQSKPAVGLIPAEALEAEGYVWGFGARKYGEHNWRNGLSVLRICGAILRHTMAIMRGEDIDSESGQPHAAHIRCDAAMLIAFRDRKDLDDRFKGNS